MFAALSHAAFFMSTEDFLDVRGVFDFCHIKSWYFVNICCRGIEWGLKL
jgi:hypothetical protein